MPHRFPTSVTAPQSDEGCLLTHHSLHGSSNCLTVALHAARPQQDEIVFLSLAAVGNEEGHVVLRDAASGAVREPGAATTTSGMSADDYAARYGFHLLGAATPSDLERLLALPPAARGLHAQRAGGTIEAVAHRRFGAMSPVSSATGGTPQAPVDPKDDDVSDWLKSLGDSIPQQVKDRLAQTAHDAHALEDFFNAHKRGDPALNRPPQDIADGEDRLLSSLSITKQLAPDGTVTRDAIHDFIGRLDGAAQNAKGTFEEFLRNVKDASPDARNVAAQASILQADLPIIDAASGKDAKVDQKFNLDDLKAIAKSEDAGVPDPLRKAAQAFTDPASFRSLVTSGDAGDGLVNDKGVSTVIKTNVGAAQTDGAVHDYLNNLGDAVSDEDKRYLALVGDDATTLKAWFDAHDRGDSAINDQPKAIADAQARLLGNKAVEKRITVEDGDDKGKVTRDTLGSFVDDLNKAAGDAKKSWDGFKKDNPNPNTVTKRDAVNASILQANLPVLDKASAGGKLDGKIDLQDIQAYAAADSISPLGVAAAAYSSDGAFGKIDTANDDPSIRPDGIAANQNFDAYLTKGTSKSADTTVSSLRNDATQNAIKNAGGDASKVTPDYFKDPAASKASGADKTAAMMQLSSSLSRLNAGEAAFGTQDAPNAFSNADDFHRAYPGEKTPGEIRDGLNKEIQDKITTLSKDKDVQSFLTTDLPKQLKADVAKDPGLKASFQAEYDNTSSSKALQDAFGGKDKDGKPLTTTAALAQFEQNPNFYAQALGITPNFSKAFDNAPQDIKDKIKQGYDEITSGKSMDSAVAAKISPENALTQAVSDKTVYDAVLDQPAVDDGSAKFGDAVSARAREDVTKGLSGDDMIKSLGFSGVDDPKLEQFVKDNLSDLVGPGTSSEATADVLSGLRQVNDSLRGGAKFEDSLKKLNEALSKDKYVPKWADTAAQYKAGVLHGVSGLFLAGAMGARLAATGNTNAVQTAQQSLSAAGLLTEGGTKYFLNEQADTKKAADEAKQAVKNYEEGHETTYATDDEYKRLQADASTKNDAWKKIENPAKNLENVGKTVGGVAGGSLGFFSGILGAKNAAESGNAGDAAAQGLLAGLNGISATASAGEVATYLAPKWGTLSQAQADSAAAWGARFGMVGGVVGGVAAAAGLIYTIVTGIIEDVKKNNTEGSWYDQVQDGLAPTGIKLPNRFDLLSPQFGYEPDDTSAD